MMASDLVGAKAETMEVKTGVIQVGRMAASKAA